MYYQKRGSIYSFIYYDTTLKKNVRLNREMHPLIDDPQVASEFCKHWDATQDSIRARIQTKMKWQRRFYKFQDLIEIYERARKEDAPNSWKDCVNSLKHYILPFFLERKKESNVNNWHFHYEEFRDYLEDSRPLKLKTGAAKERLAYGTMNNIIAAFNAFIVTLHRRQLIEKDHKCRQFSNHKLRRRGLSSVIDEESQAVILSLLTDLHPLSACFFRVSLHTGLRLNEQLGLSLSDFFSQAPESEVILTALEPYRLQANSYLSIESQPARHAGLREGKLIPRKPLKGKKRMDPGDCRIIPIFDLESYKCLVRLWNEQQALFESKKFGSCPDDYLLFDGLTRSIYSRNLRLAQKYLKFGPYTPHEARHTYSTWLAEKTGGNYTLCRMILGHSDVDITMRYIHLNAKIQKQLRTKMQLSSPIEVEPNHPTGANFSYPTNPESAVKSTKPVRFGI